MKCPVCKTELIDGTKRCPNCSFDDIRTEFINTDEAIIWMEKVVIPYRAKKSVSLDSLYMNQVNEAISQCAKTDDIKLPFEYNNYLSGLEITKYYGNAKHVCIPDSINGLTINRIGNEVFRNCKELEAVILPSFLKEIGDFAFMRSGIKSIVLPSTLSVIGTAAFCETKIEQISIPTSVTCIKERAFERTEINEIEFPENIRIIPKNVCFLCKNLKMVVIRNAVSIDDSAFSCCYWNGSESIKILLSPNLVELRTGALRHFYGNIMLPKSLQKIDIKLVFCDTDYNLQHMREKNGYISANVAFKNDNITFEGEYRGKFSGSFFCNPGSTAQQYAREHGFKTQPLSEFSID